MLDFRSPFLEAMNQVDAAKIAGHLIYPGKYVTKYKGEPDMNSVLMGKTTHPSFEQLPQGQMLYRIKPGVSASEAIESLLTSHETVIECGVALAITYNLVVLHMMEKHHGRDAGKKRFDRLFGEKDKETPTHRRLVISVFSVVMGTQPYSHLDLMPVQPLSFFIDQRGLESKGQLAKEANVGTQIIFQGDPNYVRIHPAGVHGAYNCVVTSLSPLKVRSPDVAGKEITEEDIYPIHIKAYSKAPSYQSMSMYEPGFLASRELNELIAKGTQESKIPGFAPVMFKINEEKCRQLITMDIEKMVEILDRYLIETKLRCLQDKLLHVPDMELMDKLFNDLSITPAKSQTPKEKPSMPEFADLKGLVGAFVSKPAVDVPTTEVYAGLKGLAGAFVSAKPAPAAAGRKIAKH